MTVSSRGAVLSLLLNSTMQYIRDIRAEVEVGRCH